MKSKINESDFASPSEAKHINSIKDNPVVRQIKSYFKKDLKDVSLVTVIESGDVYTIDLRFEVLDPDIQTQYVREQAKQRAYDIKRIIETGIMKDFNIPTFSIQGIRTVKEKTCTVCEFSISFIYANQGNLKPTNESIKKIRANALLKFVLRENDEKEIGNIDLENAIKEWKVLSLAIQAHEDAFRKMIENKLSARQETEEKVYAMMEKLDVKTKKVDDIVAKIIAGGFKSQGPTPTEKVAILMSKINEATKKVVQAEFLAKTIQNPFAQHKSIKFDKSKEEVTEGVVDTVKSGYGKFKEVLINWINAVKGMFIAVDELERLVGA